jgi:outer membrane receptor for Fe3+-dicitrate
VPRLWAAVGGSYGSGLPTEFEGDVQDALEQYGPEIVGRVDLARGRVRPSFSLDASVGADLWKQKNCTLRVQVDAQNLTNRLNLINFEGLFSGTALGPPRSFAVRLQADF